MRTELIEEYLVKLSGAYAEVDQGLATEAAEIFKTLTAAEKVQAMNMLAETGASYWVNKWLEWSTMQNDTSGN